MKIDEVRGALLELGYWRQSVESGREKWFVDPPLENDPRCWIIEYSEDSGELWRVSKGVTLEEFRKGIGKD